MSSRSDPEAPRPHNVASMLACLLAFGIGVEVAGSDSGPAPADLPPAAVVPAFRVCADPNNLPFTNAAGQGFENQIAALVARDLGARLQFTWQPERRGFLRQTLEAHRCDAVFGVPADDPRVLTTRPYYRSSYVFVARPGESPVRSLADPRLSRLRIGIHVIGDDYNSLPSGVALARRGLVRNVTGYSIYGDYAHPSPPHLLIDAVARGKVDLAIAWGPLAGYYAALSHPPLQVTPIPAAEGGGAARFVYDIAVGVRQGDRALRDRLDGILARRQRDIEQILDRYGIPVVPVTQSLAARSGP